MTTEAQKLAVYNYDRKNTKGLYLKLNKKTDADIIEYLKRVDNVQGLIKRLIREEMTK